MWVKFVAEYTSIAICHTCPDSPVPAYLKPAILAKKLRRKALRCVCRKLFISTLILALFQHMSNDFSIKNPPFKAG